MNERESANEILDFIKDSWQPLIDAQRARLKKGAQLLERGVLTNEQKNTYAELQEITNKMESAGKNLRNLTFCHLLLGYSIQEMLAEVPWCRDIINGNYRELTDEEKPQMTKFLVRLKGYCEELQKKDLES